MKFALRQLNNRSLRSRLLTKKKRQLSFPSTLRLIWQFLIRVLTETPELQVWCTEDKQGRLWWHAYDPNTERSVSHISEAQMRVWIERRHLNH